MSEFWHLHSQEFVNFGIRIGIFVLIGCLVVLFVGIIARFMFEDARTTDSGSEAGEHPSAPAAPSAPSQPSRAAAA